MATGNPLHRDTADRFNDENYEQPFYGTSNVTVIRGKDTKQSGFSANTNQAPRKIIQRSQFKKQETDSEQENYFNPAENPTTESRVRTPQTTHIERSNNVGFIRTNIARVRATALSIIVGTLAIFCYVGQLVLALLSIIAFGLAASLFELNATSSLLGGLTEYVGVTPEALFALYLIACLLIFGLNFIQIFTVTWIYKAALLHPWFGRGTTFKLGAIILTLIGSFIPILNMFPLIYLWIAAVMLNPK